MIASLVVPWLCVRCFSLLALKPRVVSIIFPQNGDVSVAVGRRTRSYSGVSSEFKDSLAFNSNLLECVAECREGE